MRPWWAEKPLAEMSTMALIERLALELFVLVVGLGSALILLAREFGISPWWTAWPAFMLPMLLDLRARRHRRP